MKTECTSNDLPFDRSWWIDQGRVIGGRFPGTRNPAESLRLLERLLEVGVCTIINLLVVDELGRDGLPFPDYAVNFKKLASEQGLYAEVKRAPVKDMDVPTPEQMRHILNEVDRAVRDGHRVYVHCWGGHGRTATVAGCWLVRSGADPVEALTAIARARHRDPHLSKIAAPQTEAQIEFVRLWPQKEPPRRRVEFLAQKRKTGQCWSS